MKCGERRNATQDISERVPFVAFLRVTSCPSWLRFLNLTHILRHSRLPFRLFSSKVRVTSSLRSSHS